MEEGEGLEYKTGGGVKVSFTPPKKKVGGCGKNFSMLKGVGHKRF